MNFLKKSILFLTLSFLLGSQLSGHIRQPQTPPQTAEELNENFTRINNRPRRTEKLFDHWWEKGSQMSVYYYGFKIKNGNYAYKVKRYVKLADGVYGKQKTSYFEGEAEYRSFKDRTSE